MSVFSLQVCTIWTYQFFAQWHWGKHYTHFYTHFKNVFWIVWKLLEISKKQKLSSNKQSTLDWHPTLDFSVFATSSYTVDTYCRLKYETQLPYELIYNLVPWVTIYNVNRREKESKISTCQNCCLAVYLRGKQEQTQLFFAVISWSKLFWTE